MEQYIKDDILMNISEIEEVVLGMQLNKKKLLNKIYRAYHAIKGLADFSDSERIAEAANAAAFMLDDAMRSDEELNNEIITYIVKTYHAINEIITKELGK